MSRIGLLLLKDEFYKSKEITKKIQYDNRKPVVVDHDIFPVRYYQVSMPGNDDLKELFVDKIVEDSKNLLLLKDG